MLVRDGGSFAATRREHERKALSPSAVTVDGSTTSVSDRQSQKALSPTATAPCHHPPQQHRRPCASV